MSQPYRRCAGDPLDIANSQRGVPHPSGRWRRLSDEGSPRLNGEEPETSPTSTRRCRGGCAGHAFGTTGSARAPWRESRSAPGDGHRSPSASRASQTSAEAWGHVRLGDLGMHSPYARDSLAGPKLRGRHTRSGRARLGCPQSLKRLRITAVAQRPEVRAAQRNLDKFAGDLHVPEVQRGNSAPNDSAPLVAWRLKAKECTAIAGLARVHRLHRLRPSLVWIPPGQLDIALLTALHLAPNATEPA